MFIKKSTRTYKGQAYTNYLLVESVRTPKGPRQKTLCSLGNLDPRPAGEWLKLAHRVEQTLAGQEDLFDPLDAEVKAIVKRARAERVDSPAGGLKMPGVAAGSGAEDDRVSVRTGAVRTEHHREAGPVHVGVRIWERFGLDGILAEAGLSERAAD